MKKKIKYHLARSLQGKGFDQQREKEIASMLAGTDLVPISIECVRSILKRVHYFLHEVAKPDEEPRLFMKRAFRKLLCNESIIQSQNLCLIMHVAERRQHISEKEIEELNAFICNLTMRRISCLSINWGIKANPEVKNMEIFIIASEPQMEEGSNNIIINNLNILDMKINNYLSQVLAKTSLTPVEKIKILADKLKDIDVQFTSTIADLSQYEQMMTIWYNDLKKDWSKLHDATNPDGNGHCLIIKRDENDPGVEIGFWLGEDNADNDYIPYWGAYCGKEHKPTQDQIDMVNEILKECGINAINTNKTDLENGWIAWNNYNGNGKLTIVDICTAIYNKAKELGYLVEE